MKRELTLLQVLGCCLFLASNTLAYADGNCAVGEHMVCRNVGEGHYGTCDCVPYPNQELDLRLSAQKLNVHCLSDMRDGKQWAVTALSSPQDPRKITVSLSSELNRQKQQPSLVFTGDEEDLNDGWGGFSVFDETNDELTVSGDFGGVIKAEIRKSGVSASINEPLTCFAGNEDIAGFVGIASGSPVPGGQCTGSSASPAAAQADANRQATLFCGEIGRIAVRLNSFSDVDQCEIGNPEGLGTGRAHAIDTVQAYARFRCE